MAQCFYDALGSIERATLCSHMARVGPLAPTRFEPASFFAEIEHGLHEAFFRTERYQTRPKRDFKPGGQIPDRSSPGSGHTSNPTDGAAHQPLGDRSDSPGIGRW